MSNPIYYPNRDMLASGFPTNWTLLKRLMWVRIMQGGSIPPEYETVTGNPVSFTAKAAPLRKLEVAFSPVQDLHGYDSPWPAGGGKNLLKYATAIVTNTTARFQSILLKGGTTYTISYYGATNVRIIIYDNASGTTIATSSYTKVYQFSPADDTAVDIAFYNSDRITSAENLFQAEAGTQSTSFAPYENLCPISGWTGANVYDTKKNLIDPSACQIKRYINTRGEVTYSDDWSATDYISVKAGQKYTLSGVTQSGWAATYSYYDSTKTFISYEFTYNNYTLTIPQGAVYVRLSLHTETPSIAQFEMGTTATAHEDYTGRTVNISWETEAGTVYGGTLDVVTGVLTVDKAAVDMSALLWSLSTLNRWKSTSLGSTAKYPPNNTTATTAKSESLKSMSMLAINADSLTTGIAFYNAIDGIFARNGSTTEPPTGKLVYELDAPQTIQLTPQEVESLAGDNTMWSDANGDLTVEYRSN